MSDNTKNTENAEANSFTAEDYFKIYDELDSEFDEEAFDRAVAEYRAQTAEAVRILEAKYHQKSLKFTQPFAGSIPIQAFGAIDGMLFYFRFRGDGGSLQVGTISENYFEEKLARDIWNWEGFLPDGPLGCPMPKPTLQAPNGVNDMPDSIKKHATINNYTGERYNSSLDKDEMIDVFSKLVDSLEDVDQDL